MVIKAPNVTAPAVQEAIGQLEWRAITTGLMHEPIIVDVNADETVANVAIPVDGDGTDDESNAALAALRDDVVPLTVGALPNAEVAVAGFAAESKDFNDEMKSVAPLVFGFVLLFAFVLLLFAFRSLVIAVKAIVLNLLSVGGRLRDPRARVPARLGQGAARLRVHGRHRPVPADLPVRDPVRAVDGLPRLHPQPGPRGLRPRHDHRRGGRPRDQDHRRGDHERRDRHGLRLLDLRACSRS